MPEVSLMEKRPYCLNSARTWSLALRRRTSKLCSVVHGLDSRTNLEMSVWFTQTSSKSNTSMDVWRHGGNMDATKESPLTMCFSRSPFLENILQRLIQRMRRHPAGCFAN